jgi:hypothetical protein
MHEVNTVLIISQSIDYYIQKANMIIQMSQYKPTSLANIALSIDK